MPSSLLPCGGDQAGHRFQLAYARLQQELVFWLVNLLSDVDRHRREPARCRNGEHDEEYPFGNLIWRVTGSLADPLLPLRLAVVRNRSAMLSWRQGRTLEA